MPHITFDLLLFIIISINFLRIFFTSRILSYLSQSNHSLNQIPLKDIFASSYSFCTRSFCFPLSPYLKQKKLDCTANITYSIGCNKMKQMLPRQIALFASSFDHRRRYNAGLINIFFFLFLLITRFDSAEISLLISLWDIAQILSRVFLVFN